MRSERQPLLGRRVLVTRPMHQSAALCGLIEQAGGIAVRLPALTVAEPADPAAARRRLQALSDIEMGIFISRNAVDKAVELLRPASLPEITWLAVGQATANALREQGYTALMPDRDFSSEGLLALPALQNVRGKRIAIIRGAGGRELLAETLRARGAIIEYIETYRRILPPGAADDLREILKAQAAEPVTAINQEKPRVHGIDMVTVTSTLILQNLLEMSGDRRNQLMTRPLVTLSARARSAALAAGFTRVYIAPRSDDTGIVEALIQATAAG